jgi:hypothetical protein
VRVTDLLSRGWEGPHSLFGFSGPRGIDAGPFFGVTSGDFIAAIDRKIAAFSS